MDRTRECSAVDQNMYLIMIKDGMQLNTVSRGSENEVILQLPKQISDIFFFEEIEFGNLMIFLECNCSQ